MSHLIQHTCDLGLHMLRDTQIAPVSRRVRRSRPGVVSWATVLVLLGAAACGSGDREGGREIDLSSQAVTQTSSPSASAARGGPAQAGPGAQALSVEESSARAEIALENVEQHTGAWQQEYRRNELAALRVALQTKRDLLKQAESVRPAQATGARDLLDQKTARLQSNITAIEGRVQALEAQSN
jgi:hypothetical protein